ncbi:unnamed protein product [Mesocestoides corti]|uniref:Rapamycin-insensitive companion of mTOR N-terminal domain-containing protein n=1 Tax=Mesocestoides corti TaxID=53468 RepID=A0A0R3UFV3_MESCO|nr:unnamed protein product [Mesocestoides corti]
MISPYPLPLITHLLFQCWSDFSQVYGASNVKGLEQLNHIYEKLTDRLNVLVILSSKVYLRLRYAAHLRQSLLLAVYRVLSLALWSRQRALRCASLRCLRYHLRSSSDVDLFLTNRLDVFLTRCLDLSYEEELLTPSSTTIRDQNALQEKDRIQRMLQPAGAFRRRVDGCQPVGGNGVLQRPIRIELYRPFYCASLGSEIDYLPGSVTCPPSVLTPRGVWSLCSRPLSEPGNLVVSTEISPRNAITSSGERMSVLQVAFQLLRLSPQSFSPDLVYGLAASLTSTSHRSAVTRGRGSDRERDDDFFPLSPSIQTNTTRERDVCQRGYLLLLTEYVVRNFEMQPPQSPQSLSRMSLSHPLEVAIKCLVSSLPCCGEVGEVYKHPSQLLEMLLLVLVRVSAESRLGRRLVGSWVFQKCVSPFMAGYPLVTIPRSPYDSNPSFLAATRDSLVFILRSWPGLFYFLSEGRNCLISLVSSLAVGSSKLRILVLSLLYNLFPGIPAPLPNVAGENTIDKVLAGLSSALLTGLAYPLEHFQSKRQPSANECFPPFPYLDGDFVVEEGMRVFPVVQAAGTDILEAHSSLLLCSLVESGLFEALVAAVNDESPYTSAAAGQLLGILAFRPLTHSWTLFSECASHLDCSEFCSLVLIVPFRRVHVPYSTTTHVYHIFEMPYFLQINSQLPLGSPCVARLQSVRLLGTNSQAVDYLDRIHRLLLDLHHSSRNSRILAPLHSPFLECLADQRLGLRRSSPRTPLARTSPVKNEGTNVATVLRKTAASSRSTVLPQASFDYSPLDEFVENIVVQSRVLSLATTPLLTINSATTTATSLLLNSIKHTANGSITSPVCKSSLPSNTGVPTNNYGSVASGVSPVTPYSSPYEWNWELLATWGRRLARIDTGSVFSWREHNRQL